MTGGIMPKYLVIVESPNKVKKIQSYLGKDYRVCASSGHIRDLPKKGIGIDFDNNFEPSYEIMSDKKEIVKNIQKYAKDSEIVYIMTDPDREGEGISFHIRSVLPTNTVSRRASSNSITHDAIVSAIESAGDINCSLVDSYECRRILDRIVGFKCSFVAKQSTGGISVGRVQSAGLRILSEREKEIQKFVPQEYWPIEVTLERKNGERVVASIKKPDKMTIKSKIEADNVIDVLRREKWTVTKYETKEASTKAYAPFTTSTMYQSGSNILGWNSKKSAAVSQALYEAGDITYIRTDSTFIVPEFVSAMRSTVNVKYGSNYCPSSPNSFASQKSAQEAHEAIRITDIDKENVGIGDNSNLYKLIWKRSVASQMSDMVQLRGSGEFTCEQFIFSASASKVTFDGWRRVWDYGNLDNTELPHFTIGEELKLVDVKTEQKFTSPPSRYTEASFIKELEKRGIGRPSTYKTIIEVLKERKYIEMQQKSFHVPDLGMRVTEFLVKSNFCFADLGFSASMEEDLDRIANRDANKLDVLNSFWERLQSDLDNAKNIKNKESVTEHNCPKCAGGKLVKKHSRFGAFYTCSNRTDKGIKCDYKCDIGENGIPVEKVSREKEYSSFCCHHCGKPLLIRSSKKNKDYKYLGCENWKDPECSGFYNVETGEKLVFKKKAYKNYKKKEG
jgi:DNA topoisomerase-1